MGLFANATTFPNSSLHDIERAFQQYAETRGGVFDRGSQAPPVDESQVRTPSRLEPQEIEPCVIDTFNGKTTFLFGRHVGDPWLVSKEISRLIDDWALSFHIHDGDLWNYDLHRSGEHLEAFSTVPQYFGGDDDFPMHTPNPIMIFEAVPNCSPSSVSNYFREWSPELENQKAYPTDRFGYCDCRQLVDFMAALHLRWPYDDTGKPIGDERILIDGEYHRERLAKLRELDAPEAIIHAEECMVARCPNGT